MSYICDADLHLARQDFQPVIYVVVPAATTPKGLMLAFANFLGLPMPNRYTADRITESVCHVLKELGTTMVILDEVHNLRTNRFVGAEAASSLKVFSERLDATFVYAGINLPNTDLFSGDIGLQIKGRVQVYELRRYGFGNQEFRAQWEDLVAACEDLLVLSRHESGALVHEARYLYDRTGGSIGSLRSLLADAATSAILDESERVTRALLDELVTDRQAEEFHVQQPAAPSKSKRTKRTATRQAG